LSREILVVVHKGCLKSSEKCLICMVIRLPYRLQHILLMFSAMFSVSPCTRICARCTHVFCCTVYMLSASSCTCFLLHPVHAFCFILYMFSAAPCTCFLLHPVHVFCCTLCCCQMTVRKHICSTRTTDVDCRTSAADEIVEVLVVYLFVFTSMLWLFSFYWQILCFLHSCSRYMLTVY